MIAEYKGKTYECSFFKGKILLALNSSFNSRKRFQSAFQDVG